MTHVYELDARVGSGYGRTSSCIASCCALWNTSPFTLSLTSSSKLQGQIRVVYDVRRHRKYSPIEAERTYGQPAPEHVYYLHG